MRGLALQRGHGPEEIAFPHVGHSLATASLLPRDALGLVLGGVLGEAGPALGDGLAKHACLLLLPARAAHAVAHVRGPLPYDVGPAHGADVAWAYSERDVEL